MDATNISINQEVIMGIGFMDGNTLAEMLIRQSAACLNCGRSITFEEGADCARNSGITDNVVKCPHCGHIFITMIVPGRMSFTEDVTAKYAR